MSPSPQYAAGYVAGLEAARKPFARWIEQTVRPRIECASVVEILSDLLEDYLAENTEAFDEHGAH